MFACSFTLNLFGHRISSRSASQMQWDFWARGRLMFWGEDNHWWQASELVRTGKAPETCLTGEVLYGKV